MPHFYSLAERIEHRVNKNGPIPIHRGLNTPCWLWLGALANRGYAQTTVNGRRDMAHRVVYEFLVGPIPRGLTLDHLCMVHHCVNPEHLEPVTNKVNTLRGNNPCAKRARQTHCKRGHPLVGDNLELDRFGRHCKACHQHRERERYRNRCLTEGQ
jgi:hypothetical protein